MTTFELSIIAGCLCAILMVAGGLFLLYRGAITLTEASKEAALTIELQKIVRITTRYPALGLFAIAFAFFIMAGYFAVPPSLKPIQLKGRVRIADPGATVVNVTAGPWTARVPSTGDFEGTVVPTLQTLIIEVVAPGYTKTFSKTFAIAGSKVDLGEVTEGDLGHKKLDRPPFDPAAAIGPARAVR